MFTIHYILNDKISFRRCKDEIELKIIYRALMKQNAKLLLFEINLGNKLIKS